MLSRSLSFWWHGALCGARLTCGVDGDIRCADGCVGGDRDQHLIKVQCPHAHGLCEMSLEVRVVEDKSVRRERRARNRYSRALSTTATLLTLRDLREIT